MDLHYLISFTHLRLVDKGYRSDASRRIQGRRYPLEVGSIHLQGSIRQQSSVKKKKKRNMTVDLKDNLSNTQGVVHRNYC